MFGIKADWSLEVFERYFTLDDYGSGTEARWCSGCGDFAILNTVHRVLRDAQVPPEKSVAVSGIGCSSRMPHYMGTYGLHGLHGRALPLANGIKSRRPDLDVWVATGDGDCFSIGAGPWLHSLHLNMDMVILVFDNGIYGLTKKQTSPTTQQGTKTNTHPYGAILPPLNPLTITLGITNISFVAQVVDWNPPLLYETIKAAHQHRGTSFIRVLQRCPVFSEEFTKPLQENPDKFTLLEHEDGITIDDNVKRLFHNVVEHDPSDWLGAMKYAKDEENVPLGLLFKDPDAVVYEDHSSQGLGMTNEEKAAGLKAAFDKFSI
ncbi:MAG: 2-oxoglutarate oxidoreductase [gamma proteobacterium symbiont of Bathyaustriella thionipta]|nr:2-oxoglutarate oxidoreductase [gamma proteobacterium symbiont of Bathyaustriella thionipta]MCU7948898.1 2-oxoglutarate oxidoreductase [gamma proteobacterium symbiont of Bathyaustriella thionipta]MCU7953212.1 2-oxoglutarate oxidoreductase [gamma proteobacterium symbiont of Bathyaustriella thionipta]MCU7955472.1 2-oxoglutarate oxidoreductase [gamma proteobacterium symbiont of Bathyaustriella thionipta]MCU7965679.1 2-oxoglutarate oxidoreductase [gamma proteobacterium symbiont of Bathyaustriella